MLAAGDQPGQLGFEANLAAKGDNLVADGSNHALQPVSADVGLLLIKDFLRRAVADEGRLPSSECFPGRFHGIFPA